MNLVCVMYESRTEAVGPVSQLRIMGCQKQPCGFVGTKIPNLDMNIQQLLYLSAPNCRALASCRLCPMLLKMYVFKNYGYENYALCESAALGMQHVCNARMQRFV